MTPREFQEPDVAVVVLPFCREHSSWLCALGRGQCQRPTGETTPPVEPDCDWCGDPIEHRYYDDLDLCEGCVDELAALQ